MIPARQSESADLSSLPVIIHEEIEDRIASAIGYIDRVLDHVDPTERLTRLAILAAVQGGGHVGWRTRAEHAASPNSVQMNPWASSGAAGLSPPDRARGALRTNGRGIAQDLATRLRRIQEA
jgi:hypothetical protein